MSDDPLLDRVVAAIEDLAHDERPSDNDIRAMAQAAIDTVRDYDCEMEMPTYGTSLHEIVVGAINREPSLFWQNAVQNNPLMRSLRTKK